MVLLIPLSHSLAWPHFSGNQISQTSFETSDPVKFGLKSVSGLGGEDF